MSAPAATAATLFEEASRHYAANRLDDAKVVLGQLLAAEPHHAQGLNLLGITIGGSGDPAGGCGWVEQAIAADGGNVVYLRNLCELRRQAGDPFGAVTAGRRAIAAAPDDGVAAMNLAMAEQDALELDSADTRAARVLRDQPDNASAHFLRAQIALLRGEFATGWREYAWRWRIPGAERPRPAAATAEWDGTPVAGPLLLIGDQGFGDMIQFCRYLPWAAARCDALVVCCPRELRALIQRWVPDVRCLVDLAQAGQAAAYADFSSLPGLAQTAPDRILHPDGYLRADPSLIRRWSARLDQLAPGPNRRIGLVWAGSKVHRGDRQRSMALRDFAELLVVPGCTFISLQKGEPVGEVGGYLGPPGAPWGPLVNLGPELADFDDTAAAVCCLESVVSVDTAVVHLAGALGRPAHVLLPYRPDWRWLLDRAESPWYSKVSLYREERPGARERAVAEVAAALRG